MHNKSVSTEIKGFGGLRLKAEFAPASRKAINLGEVTLPSATALTKYSSRDFDSNVVSKTYYELTVPLRLP